MKRRKLVLLVLILALVLSAGIGSAWAYFTTYAAASGGVALDLGYQTVFEENVVGAQKNVTIRYDDAEGANAQEVYVRVRAWGPDDANFPLTYQAGAGWEQSGDWWVYTVPLGPENPDAAPFAVLVGGLTEAAQLGDSINVAVVHECAPVLYNEDGSAVPATDPSIWNQQLIVEGTTPEGGE